MLVALCMLVARVSGFRIDLLAQVQQLIADRRRQILPVWAYETHRDLELPAFCHHKQRTYNVLLWHCVLIEVFLDGMFCSCDHNSDRSEVLFPEPVDKRPAKPGSVNDQRTRVRHDAWLPHKDLYLFCNLRIRDATSAPEMRDLVEQDILEHSIFCPIPSVMLLDDRNGAIIIRLRQVDTDQVAYFLKSVHSSLR